MEVSYSVLNGSTSGGPLVKSDKMAACDSIPQQPPLTVNTLESHIYLFLSVQFAKKPASKTPRQREEIGACAASSSTELQLVRE